MSKTTIDQLITDLTTNINTQNYPNEQDLITLSTMSPIEVIPEQNLFGNSKISFVDVNGNRGVFSNIMIDNYSDQKPKYLIFKINPNSALKIGEIYMPNFGITYSKEEMDKNRKIMFGMYGIIGVLLLIVIYQFFKGCPTTVTNMNKIF